MERYHFKRSARSIGGFAALTIIAMFVALGVGLFFCTLAGSFAVVFTGFFLLLMVHALYSIGRNGTMESSVEDGVIHWSNPRWPREARALPVCHVVIFSIESSKHAEVSTRDDQTFVIPAHCIGSAREFATAVKYWGPQIEVTLDQKPFRLDSDHTRAIAR